MGKTSFIPLNFEVVKVKRVVTQERDALGNTVVSESVVDTPVKVAGWEAPVGMTSENHSAGVFSRSRSFEAGSTDGGVWLSRQDKIKLRRWKGGAYSVKTW